MEAHDVYWSAGKHVDHMRPVDAPSRALPGKWWETSTVTIAETTDDEPAKIDVQRGGGPPIHRSSDR